MILKTIFAIGFAMVASQTLAQDPRDFSSDNTRAVSDCVLDSWKTQLDPGKQDFEFFEDIQSDYGLIRAYIYGAPKGNYAKLYVFLQQNKTCFAHAIIVGSFNGINAITPVDDRGPDGRVYHFDYFDPENHTVLRVVQNKPTYEIARKIAVGALNPDR